MTASPLKTNLARMALGVASALAVACQPLGLVSGPPAAVSTQTAVTATMTLDPAAIEGTKERLSGKYATDYTRTLVSSPTRWGRGAAAGYKIKAFGAPDIAAWTGGVNLQAAPFNLAGDFSTNGMAFRLNPKYATRVFLITRNGKLVGLDPDNPTVGYSVTNLADTFTKTYVTLSGDGSIAFVVADSGKVYAVNVANPNATTPASYSFRSITLSSTCRGGALFLDPVPPNSEPNYCKSTLYVVDNAGTAHRIKFDPGGYVDYMSAALFPSIPFSEVLPAVSLTTATPLNGTDKVKASPVVLNGQLVVGDRAGNVIQYNYNTSAKVTTSVNYGWPIETPIAVDVDDNLNITDLFACAGGQMQWVKPNGTLYMGQYAVVEKGAADGNLNAATFSSFANLQTAVNVTASGNYQSFSAATSATDDTASLPGAAAPGNLDVNHLTHCGFLTGLPPDIAAWAGKLNTKFYYYYPWDTATGTNASDPVLLNGTYYPGSGTTVSSNPVQDGEALTGANLLSPSAIDFDDDGSSFVADTNHCQVLFNPASPTAWNRWFPAAAMSTAAFNWRAGARPDGNTTIAYAGTPANSPPENNFYVFAGTLFPNAPCADGQWSGRDNAEVGSNAASAGKVRDVGNGAGGPVWTIPAQCPANGNTGGAIARGTAINRAQGIAVGNLGLYVANRNAFNSGNPNGQILFMPRAGLGTGPYWGISNPQPGRMYVICNFVDPQGLDVYRDPANATRDVVFAPCMNASSPDRNKVFKLDSTTTTSATTAATAGVTIATSTAGTGVGQGALNDPYDVGLDDNGNLFIADHGSSTLKMIAKVVPKTPGAPTRNWGTAGVAGNVYAIRTGMNEICSVSFANNDPQLPANQGCVYIGLGAAPTSNPNRIVRFDETLYYQAVAGADFGYINTAFPAGSYKALADAGDGGNGNAVGVSLAMPWRARGRFNASNNTYETYICDRGNNRIRRIVSSAGSASATGYLSFPMTGALGKPIYIANLTLTSRLATGAFTAPEVGLASPYLKGTTTMWSNTNMAAGGSTVPAAFLPTKVPPIDITINRAAPLLTPWTATVGSTHKYRLPAQAIQTSTTNGDFQHLRLGMQSPVDTNFYFYPTSSGTLTTPNVKSPDFYTNMNGATVTTYPKLDYTYGTLAMSYPILSPPAIYYASNGERYVYLCNANALWRYNVTSPSTFITAANGAEVVFTKSVQGRVANGNGFPATITPTSFQFNAAAPIVMWGGKVAMLDNTTTSLVTPYNFNYSLSMFNGDLAASNTNMWTNTSATIATGVSGTVTDNAGVYLASDPFFSYAYTGLSNGRIYKMALN